MYIVFIYVYNNNYDNNAKQLSCIQIKKLVYYMTLLVLIIVVCETNCFTFSVSLIEVGLPLGAEHVELNRTLKL